MCHKVLKVNSVFFSKEATEKEEENQGSDPTIEGITEASSSRVDGNSDPRSDEVKSVATYQGYILNINRIQGKVGNDVLRVYHEKFGSRKRLLAKCLICMEYEEDVKKCSSYGFCLLMG